MTKELFLELVERVKDGSANDQDLLLYNAWFNKFQTQKAWDDAELGNAGHIRSLMEGHIKAHVNASTLATRVRPLWTKLVAAASVLLFISVGSYYFIGQHGGNTTYKNDVEPGQNSVTLTLASGEKIFITKGSYRKLTQGTTAIQINNSITYTTGLKNKDAAVAYNTLSTATGEKSPYPLILPDGSKVWLNAKSSITFPTAFNSKERIVKVTGEALFEVVHNAKQPFKVQTEKQIIEDIGTTFDVNAYNDEPVTNTTLVEGKVKVNNIFLEPGEQTDGAHIKTVNTKRYTAWKNDDFYFEDDNIQIVMRELSRWYGVRINYEGSIPSDRFNAQISRAKNISVILNILENTKGVHFKVEGKEVTVIK